ncbi:MAG TPA: tetratricopeptide repeat protein [Sphingomonadales bacterium]|nr:tetratricopeptide repeat protein [Sphingomonadales bacterium]
MWKLYGFGLWLLLLLAISGTILLPSNAEENSITATSPSQTADILSSLKEQVNAEPKLALEKIRTILDQKPSSLSLQKKIELTGYQSGAYERLGNFKKGLEVGQAALDLANKHKVDNHIVAYIHNAIGKNQEGMGQMSQSMQSYKKAYNDFQAANDPRGMASAKLNLAGLFVGTKLFNDAIREYEKALSLLDPESDRFLYTRTLNNLGFTHIENGAAEKAFKYLKLARDLSQKMGNKLVIAYTYENSGEAYYHTGQYDKSKEYLLFALQIAEKNGIEPLITGIYYYLGLIEFAQKDYSKSESHAAKALKMALKNDDVGKLPGLYNLLSNQARQKKDYKTALEYQDLKQKYEEIVTNKNIVTALSLLETEFQLKERQQEITLLQRDNQIQKLSLQKEKGFRYLGGGLVVILFLGVGFLLYILHIKSQTTKLAIAREEDLMESKLAAEAANRAKSEFLSYMSHELRTPLNAVIGFSETLRLPVFGTLTEKQTEFVDYIHESGTLLLKLINDLLHLSKIESGAVDLDLKQHDMSEIILNVIPMVQHILDKRQIHLHEENIQKNLSPVIVDNIRMDQILVNLISNAVKYGHREGNIWLSLKEIKNGLRICVRDDGIGIAEEQFENVFTPFNRAGMELSGIEGTGAGLSIVKALVEAMGGTIGFESRLDKGTTFWIDMPVVDE